MQFLDVSWLRHMPHCPSCMLPSKSCAGGDKPSEVREQVADPDSVENSLEPPAKQRKAGGDQIKNKGVDDKQQVTSKYAHDHGH